MTHSHCIFCNEEFAGDVRICPRCHDYKGIVDDDAEFDELITQEESKPRFYDCAGCDHYHSTTWDGTCDDPGAQWTTDMLDGWYGRNGWREV